MSRAFVTASGVFAPHGHDVDTWFTNLMNRNDQPTRVESFDVADLPQKFAHEVRQFEPKAHLGNVNLRPFNRPTLFAIIAAQQALAEAGLHKETLAQTETGLVLGTMFGSIHTITAFDHNAQKVGPKYAKPMDFANTVINAVSGQLAIWHQLRGINSTVASGFTSGLAAMGQAMNFIRNGKAQRLLAGGCEELCRESFLGMQRAGLMTTDERPMPFSYGRAGFMLGEGAALMLLESEAALKERGGVAHAEIIGYGSAYDRHQGKGSPYTHMAFVQSMRDAMWDAGLNEEHIDAVSLASSGDKMMDDVEAGALREVFTQKQPMICAIKSSVGECLGAGGAMQTLAAVESLRRGSWPGIKPVDYPLLEAPGLHARHDLNWNGNTVLVNAAGPDGSFCSLVLAKPGFKQ